MSAQNLKLAGLFFFTLTLMGLTYLNYKHSKQQDEANLLETPPTEQRTCNVFTPWGTINLRDLGFHRNETSGYSVYTNEGMFRFNLCGNVIDHQCYPIIGAIPSLLNNGHCVRLSRSLDYANYYYERVNNGRVVIDYVNGDVLIPGINHGTRLRLNCDPNQHGFVSFNYFGREIINNTAFSVFDTYTSKVCPPSSSDPCVIDAGSYRINLRNASSPNGYLIREGNDISYHFNICNNVTVYCGREGYLTRPSIYKFQDRCVSISRSTRKEDIIVSHFGTESASLKYIHGDRNPSTRQEYQTLINFYCNRFITRPEIKLRAPMINPANITFVIEYHGRETCPQYK